MVNVGSQNIQTLPVPKDNEPMDEDDIELPVLPKLDKGPPPDCPICGDPMSFIDGDWACIDCNGELLGPETG